VRILILDTYYPAFLAAHYRGAPQLAAADYATQWRALMDRFFGTADSYSHYLRELGHEAQEIVVNAEPLQQAWAREHGVRRSLLHRDHALRIVHAQVAEFKPDVVYLQDLNALPVETLIALGRDHLVAGQIASEAPPAERLRAFGLLLTSFPHFVPRFRELGVQSEYLRIGFDRRVLDLLEDTPRDGAVFVGALGRLQHGRGNDVLEAAARRAPIDVYGYGVEDWPEGSPLRVRYCGEAWGLDMLRVLRGAKIAINRHIDVAEDAANNMRLYEATGVGALLLTDRKSNLGELFEPGSEVVVYDSAAELAAKVEHFLRHDEERAAIARAGQERTLAEHGYDRRMQELATILEARLP
jgi:spore maturation protein CgeB